MNHTLIYAGSGIIAIWGIAHILPVRSVVAGFGNISRDNQNILTMEWISEGLTLLFIGILATYVLYTGGVENPVSKIVILALAAMLFVFAGVTALTGARTALLPIKICPFVKTFVALLFITGILL